MPMPGSGKLSVYANANVTKVPAKIEVLCLLRKQQKSSGRVDHDDNSQRSGDAEDVEHLHLRL
jgi:hypothetical protein